MRTIIPIYAKILLIGCLCILTGCSNEILMSAPEAKEGQDVILLKMKRGDISNPEDNLQTLRLFIFAYDAGGAKLVVNQLFNTSEANEEGGVSSGSSYFVKDKENYIISELLQKATIKAMVVANELTSLDHLTTEAGVLKAQANFYQHYASSDGTMNITITEAGIPMFASTGWLTAEQWKSDNGQNTIRLSLVRTLAKITLQLKKDPTRKETFTSAFINKIPLYTVMGDSVSSYSSTDLVSTKTENLVFSDIGTSNQLVFYVPEYVLSDAKKSNYAYIQINARSEEQASNALLVYKIPVGNGVQGLYGMKNDTDGTVSGEHVMDESVLANMKASELKISRNKQYDFKVKAIGDGGSVEEGDMLVVTKLKDWTDEEVNGNIDAPSLVLSSIDWAYKTDGSSNRIYYWSNLSVELSGVKIYNKNGQTVVDDNAETSQIFANDLHLTSLAEGTSDCLGYLDFTLNDTWLAEKEQIIKLIFGAGVLKREVVVRPPLVKN